MRRGVTCAWRGFTPAAAALPPLATLCRSYSSFAKTRFSRSVEEEEESQERQYTATFLHSGLFDSTASTSTSPPASISPPSEQPPSHLAAELTPTPTASTTAEQHGGSALDGSQNLSPADATAASNDELLDLLTAITEAAQTDSTTPDDHTSTPSSKPDSESHVPIPLELLPPRRHQIPRVPLLSRPRQNAPSAGELPVDASAPGPTSPSTGVYGDLFQSSFVNPFNGRLVNTASPSAKLLFRVGFYRSPVNPLHIEWSPTEYVTALQKNMADQQRSYESKQRRWLRRRNREQRHAREAAAALKEAKRKARRGKKVDSAVAMETQVAVPPGDPSSASQEGKDVTQDPSKAPVVPLSPTEAVAQARARLLRPLRRRGPEHWMSTVAQLIERQDVFTFLNRELERLYAELGTAYVPPKLDTPVDVSVTEMELTRDQQQVMQLAKNGFSIFVGGSAGTGKTVLLKAIFRELTSLGLRVAVTATTGVAAVQLGGCTFHHAFHAPVDTTPHRWDVNALRAVDVVIVDEVSLLDASMFDAFDMEARLARMCHAPFGGLQVIVCGDFLQLSRDDAMPAYESAAFKRLVAVRLVTPMRHYVGDPLLQLLEELRRGDFNTEHFQALDRPIPADTTHITYIFPRRREAQQLNDVKLGELTSQEMTFTPQRGPLQLCGTFTRSALIEMTRDANGMQRPLPRREQLLSMLLEEAQRIVRDGAATAQFIADHEMVLMPVRTETLAATRFVLRIRTRDPGEQVDVVTPSFVATTTEGSADGGNAATASAATDEFFPPLPAAADAAFVPPAMVRTTTAAKMLAMTLRRPQRASSLFTETQWESVAGAVAARLGARLVTMLSTEPMSMVPLSVSMTLADMTSADIAHSLSPLRLKLGCRVMVNRNLSRTVSNGSVGIVEAFAPPDPALFPRNTDNARRAVFKRVAHSKLFEQLPIVRLLSGEVVQVPPVSLLVGGTAQSYYYGHEVLTIPLQLGYAFTVHKVQGLTLQGTVVLDCEKFFDCPHLIYVACSRVRRLDQLVVRHVEPRMIIVRRSALEFSEQLQEAGSLNMTSAIQNQVRAAWAQRAAPRILAPSQ